MWRPDDGWEALRGGRGPSTGGVWLDRTTTPPSVVKRLVAPGPDDPEELAVPTHDAWWRRSAAVAASGVVDGTTGLRSVPVLDVTEDAEGVTLRHAYVAPDPPPALYLASRLGAFAGCAPPAVPWLARGQLAGRLSRVEWRGGWTTLQRTSLADLADRLWQRRRHHLAGIDALPQVLQHGDPVPGNFPARDGDTALTLDWSTLGTGPVGGDLGYLALSAPESLEVLLDAYVAGLPTDLASPAEVLYGARVTAVYTIVNRAEWVLARAAAGEGALAGKFRHPSVAPTLRVLQRQYAHLEALL
ncbi:phosphotransferase [Nocardioides zeae]|uniref:Phosphotransferase n=1 Tax=Nocardioides imazamoxiresistens TaxID=3231893 RepID=A0ABU3PT62_9ACTN|nr:phosphotransferase [Nocardioides zeae]MDT9592428.1 phosphotransferase [Nocardioides zeae]